MWVGGVADELEPQLCLVLTAQGVAPSSLLARCLCPVAFSDALHLSVGPGSSCGPARAGCLFIGRLSLYYRGRCEFYVHFNDKAQVTKRAFKG